MKNKIYKHTIGTATYEYTFDENAQPIMLGCSEPVDEGVNAHTIFARIKQESTEYNYAEYAARLDRWRTLEHTISRLNAALSTAVKPAIRRTLEFQMEELEVDMADNLARFGADELNALVEYAKKPNQPMSIS